ncbi:MULTISPECIES: TetR/AcrR family transcriptional regulator [Actinoalloteichus]|uniref:Transcriptional regulator, TetR family n=1 Tax=Actinoalloteichus caeruleus DSM 43889 TaxID=1120930 RepID=A0ABT1JCR1_ACTCY|nr:TetR/AcrR family transcriptional regulator [Actinoalloteichus caeruleus]MCP2330275.1 transcriptional regulator, TetR family [Actinoalloteichus caeruleus DSM 43889]
MPRIVDHDQRRAQIALAFQRLLAAEGIAGVSFSRVAAEAGVSVGLIQHYFSGKEALLRYAYDDATSRLGQRVRQRVRSLEAAGRPVREVLVDSLVELLPLDEERQVEYRVRSALWFQATHHPGLAEVARRSGGDLLRHVTDVVVDGVRRGEVGTTLDPELAARAVLATVRGLADQVAFSGADAFPARDVLRSVVVRVIAGPEGDPRGTAGGGSGVPG